MRILGHSLTLADLATRLSRKFNLSIPVTRLVSNATLDGHLESIRDIRDGHTAAVQADLPAVLRADAVLDEDIKSSGTTMRSLSNSETVLLTGATGFLGYVYCLSIVCKSRSIRRHHLHALFSPILIKRLLLTLDAVHFCFLTSSSLR